MTALRAIDGGKFRKISGKVYRIIYKKLKTRKEISRLCGEDNVILKLLASALNATLESSASTEEKVWIDRIESFRNELNTSSTEITIVDYGAGSPDFNLTGAEMYQGRVVTSTIGKVCRIASKSRMWAFLLFKLIREFKPLSLP